MSVCDLILLLDAIDASNAAENILHILAIIHIQKQWSLSVENFFVGKLESEMIRCDER